MALSKKRTSDDRVVLQNAVKTLAANIRFSSVDKPIRSIAMVSSIPSEGKTTISANLGAALVGSGASVLLVECDMRRRSLANELHVHGKHGIYAVLSGHHTLEESVVPTKTRGLYFLDAEPGIPNPPDLLQSKRFHELISQVTKTYGYVIFDTPPVSTFIDAAIIGSLVDATVLVVRQDYTRREEVTDSINQLKQAGANLIGTVLNYCDAEVSSKYYGYYKEKKDTSGSRSRNEGAPEAVPAAQPSDLNSGASNRAAAAYASPSPAPTIREVPQQPSQPVSVPSQTSAASAPRRIVPRNRGKNGATSGSANLADETMAFLAQAGYSPKERETTSSVEEG